MRFIVKYEGLVNYRLDLTVRQIAEEMRPRAKYSHCWYDNEKNLRELYFKIGSARNAIRFMDRIKETSAKLIIFVG